MCVSRLLLVLFLFVPLASTAEESEDVAADSYEAGEGEAGLEAKELFEAAEQAFREGRYQEALDQYLASYEMHPSPFLLARIGSCKQALDDHGAAIESFERFLEEAPDSPERSDVEARLEESREILDSEMASDSLVLPLASLVPEDGEADDELPLADLGTPFIEIPADDEPRIPPKEEPALPPKEDPPSPPTDEPEWTRVPPPEPEDEFARSPLYQRWWFWAFLGATAAASGAAYVGTRPEPTYVLPSGTLGSTDWR